MARVIFRSISTVALFALAVHWIFATGAIAANIYGTLLGGQPTKLTSVTAQHPSEIGHYEYMYDVYMDNESQFERFKLEGFDAAKIINQHSFTHASISGTLTQKWDAFAQSPIVGSMDQKSYGSYNNGGAWAIVPGYTGLGEGILNRWHSIGDYTGTTSGSSVNPKFLGPGRVVPDSSGKADYSVLFVNDLPTPALYDGLVATFRIVHPAPPTQVTFSAFSANAGGTSYSNSLLGPGATVPEPSTVVLFGVALLSVMSTMRTRRRR